MAKQFYYGGNVLTMEPELYAQALLAENGRILAVGSRERLESEAGDAQRIDLRGGVLLPAFLDAHGHISSYAASLLQPGVGEAKSFGEMQAIICRFLRENQVPKGRWVTVKGLDPTQLAEGKAPDRRVLDAAAPDNPLVLQHQSGHNGVLNTLALRELGITARTPVPEGGRMALEGGEPTGFLEENAFIEALQRVPMPSPQEMGEAFVQAQRRYAAYGVTTVQDGVVMDLMADQYRYLCENKILELDVVAYGDLRDSDRFLEAFQDHWGAYRDHFKLGGYKTFLDGSPQARTAWMREPYAGATDGYRGYPTLPDAQLLTYIRRALREDRQILAHCNGDAAAQQYLDAYAQALAELDRPRDIRPVMIHAQLLGRDQLPALRALGMIPSFFVGHVYYWGDVHLQNFGRARAEAISPVKSAAELGLRYTFHQDAPVTEPDMLHTLWCAVNRLTRAGRCLGPEERVSPLEALRAVTVHAAWQYFEEDQKGSLRPGKRADLVVLDRDPLQVDPLELQNLRVLATFKDGKALYRAEDWA